MTRERKGRAYVPELAILVRDAMPLASELTDPDVGEQAKRRRAIARDVLIGLYRDAERRDALDRLDPAVRLVCEELKTASGGRLPARKGGRPEDMHFRLMVWLRVRLAIQSGARIGAAISKVAAELKPPRTERHVRDIWSDRSPEWRRLTRVTLALHEPPCQQRPSGEPPPRES